MAGPPPPPLPPPPKAGQRSAQAEMDARMDALQPPFVAVAERVMTLATDLRKGRRKLALVRRTAIATHADGTRGPIECWTIEFVVVDGPKLQAG
jgi:hypothetical protein